MTTDWGGWTRVAYSTSVAYDLTWAGAVWWITSADYKLATSVIDSIQSTSNQWIIVWKDPTQVTDWKMKIKTSFSTYSWLGLLHYSTFPTWCGYPIDWSNVQILWTINWKYCWGWPTTTSFYDFYNDIRSPDKKWLSIFLK